MATFALLPFKSKLANTTALLVLILWLMEGGLKAKWVQIHRDPLAWIPILYFFVLCCGLLWTSDLDWGLHIIKKSRRFLLIPVFISVMVRHPWVVGRGRILFITSTALTALVSLAIAFRWLAPFGHATLMDPSPFVYHTSYGPALAWAAYISFALVLFDPKVSKGWKIGLGLAGTVIASALFVNIGVAGYAAFFMLFGLLILQWRKNIIWPALAVVVLVFSVYFVSPSVHRRVNQNIREVTEYRESGSTSKKKSTSIGPRLVFWENTWQIIKKHPVLGVGTGDFPVEYEKVRQVRTPDHWKNVNNPHNMYLMIWAQSGLVGLGVVFALFGALLCRARQLSGMSARVVVGLACFFLLIMMSDAYLTLSSISLLFSLFVAGSGGVCHVGTKADP